MTNYREIDWQKSPVHVEFLGYFRSPRSHERATRYLWFSQTLKEDIGHTIQRFIDIGMLIKPTVAQAIDTLYKKPSIEELLRKLELAASGNKPQLIERLIEYAPEQALSMVGDHDLLVCSVEAIAFLDSQIVKRQSAEKAAKDQAFSALLEGDSKKAHKIFVEYQRSYNSRDIDGGGTYFAPQMEIVLQSEPNLLNRLSERERKYLQAATCMPMLWHEETTLKWLPQDLSMTYEDAEVIANLLAKYAEIQIQVGRAGHLSDEFKIMFDPYDVDSCDLCRRFDGQVLALKEMPELPDANCTSRRGCQFSIRHTWERQYDNWNNGDENEYSEDDSDQQHLGIQLFDFRKFLDLEGLEGFIAEQVEGFVKEHVEVSLDPFSKLQTLKKMLDAGLITAKEYQTVKQQVLSKF